MPGMEWDDPDLALHSFFSNHHNVKAGDERRLSSLTGGDDDEGDGGEKLEAFERAAMATFEKAERGKVCVLSIDGGGMRGIVPARILAHLETMLQQKSGDADARVADFFDVVAGASVGGILATMLFTGGPNGRPLFRAEDAWKLLAEGGRSVFKLARRSVWSKLRGRPSSGSGGSSRGPPPRFSPKPLEGLLQQHLQGEGGRALTLCDTLKPVLIPCYDLATGGPFLFSRADALESRTWDFTLWEICRAATAAPPFFPPARVASVDGKTACTAIDGRIVMHNPTAAAVTHVLHNKREFPGARAVGDLLVLSLGTGQADQAYGYEAVRGWGPFQWAKPIAKIVLDGISDAVDHTMSMAFGDHRSQYLRIQMSGLPNRSPADAGDVTRLIALADSALDQASMEHLPFGGRMPLSATNRERLDWFADQLVLERKARSLRHSPNVILKPAPS